MSKKNKVAIGIIGGTGSEIALEEVKKEKIYTPFGSTSSEILVGKFNERKVAFLPRHGFAHSIPPHNRS